VVYSTVDFNSKLQAPGLSNFRKQLNFSERRADKGLAAESRIYAHHEYVMHQRKNFLECVNGSCRVQDHSRLAPARSDEMEGAIEMNAGFLMDGNPMGTGVGKGWDELVRSLNHKMAIERYVGDLAKRSNDRRPDCEIGNEVTIHYVHVENGRATLHGGLCFSAEPGEVGRKNGRSKLDHRKCLIG